MKNLLFYNDLHYMRSFTAVQDDTLLGLLQEVHCSTISLNITSRLGPPESSIKFLQVNFYVCGSAMGADEGGSGAEESFYQPHHLLRG